MSEPFIPIPDLGLECCDVVTGYQKWAPIYDDMLTDTVDGAMLRAIVPQYFQDSPMHILDIGCGTGRNLEWLRAAGVNCTAVGCDISPEMIAIAASKQIYQALHTEARPACESDTFNRAMCILASCHMPDIGELYHYVCA